MAQHYFSEHPTGEVRTREVEVNLAGSPRSVLTAGGVFSPDRLDRGTEVLLRSLHELEPLNTPLLDLGCGWGPIALAAALENSSRDIWAVEVNERARALAQENARRLGVSNIRVVHPDDVPPDISFGEIRSNPPIRVGKSELHAILSRWVPRLAPGGAAYLVVAKHLGAPSLEAWIAASFQDFRVDRLSRSKGFHVIRAVREGAS